MKVKMVAGEAENEVWNVQWRLVNRTVKHYFIQWPSAM
jgi:hypothetical protein